MNGPEDVERLVDQWSARVAERARQFQVVQQGVSSVVVSEEAAGGAIRVTVDSSGNVRDIALSEDIQRMSASTVAQQIMGCIKRAQAQLAGRVQGIMAEVAPGDPEAAAAVVGNYQQKFPPQPSEEQGALPSTQVNAGFGLSHVEDDIPSSRSYPVAPPPAPVAAVAASPARGHASRDEDDDVMADPW
ncbi:YbaB/EbfC family nucleoid-associated protein [Solihabitans fulvus]|uniref:YbaB/EbfC family nucleoid-associated protein n=1 Tax=Solihabitans fulvus TaxID=1892852 RepID=UPI0016620075|nr:YbaB/EbfC family nucleoid-associated protein [Solihabitans fulvus]